jgi:phosphoenolpyruvate carboxylase
MRAPYVDALSRLQLRALTTLHSDEGRGDNESDQDRETWNRLLLLAVNGAAAGLQNTG